MRRRLLKWLACPTCRGDLGLLVAESQEADLSESDKKVLDAVARVDGYDELQDEIIMGALTCPRCRVYYPVHDSVPRMLTYPASVTETFARQNAGWIAEHLTEFHLPNAPAPPGEAGVLRNFSKEWTDYEWDGKHYWDTTPDHVLKAIRYSLGIPRHSLKHRLVLEVGIGIGGTADGLSRSEDCELVGMDLGYSVDQARRYFGQNPRLHIVQASVFAPPFKPGTFDVVYSHGVIHHTYSTETAFRSIAQLPKESSGMLYVWVYSHEQEKATLLRRILMTAERAVRPTLSKLPEVAQTICLLPTLPLYMTYQNLYRRRKMGADYTVKYGWKSALHAARDRLTPPFAHRHSYDEVMRWFESETYRNIEALRDEATPEGVPGYFALNVGVRGFRKPGTAPPRSL